MRGAKETSKIQFCGGVGSGYYRKFKQYMLVMVSHTRRRQNVSDGPGRICGTN